jgi:hypothetical protein
MAAMTADRSSDSTAIRPLDAAVRLHLGGLGHAACEPVADAPLVDPHRPHGAIRLHQLGEELLQAVTVPPERRRGHRKCLEHSDCIGRRQREPLFHHRLPPLQAVAVDLPQELDVHEAVADLDVGASRREQVQLIALLDPRRGQRGQGVLGRSEVGSEDTPFPTRDDRSHRPTLRCQ